MLYYVSGIKTRAPLSVAFLHRTVVSAFSARVKRIVLRAFSARFLVLFGKVWWVVVVWPRILWHHRCWSRASSKPIGIVIRIPLKTEGAYGVAILDETLKEQLVEG